MLMKMNTEHMVKVDLFKKSSILLDLAHTQNYELCIEIRSCWKVTNGAAKRTVLGYGHLY